MVIWKPLIKVLHYLLFVSLSETSNNLISISGCGFPVARFSVYFRFIANIIWDFFYIFHFNLISKVHSFRLKWWRTFLGRWQESINCQLSQNSTWTWLVNIIALSGINKTNKVVRLLPLNNASKEPNEGWLQLHETKWNISCQLSLFVDFIPGICYLIG